MTAPDDATRVRHMMDATRRALQIATGLDRGSLPTDSIEVLALVRLLEVLGEAARGTSAGLQAAYPDVPWRQMIGTRNRIIHAYFDVDLDIVWKIVEDELPALLTQLEQIPTGNG